MNDFKVLKMLEDLKLKVAQVSMTTDNYQGIYDVINLIQRECIPPAVSHSEPSKDVQGLLTAVLGLITLNRNNITENNKNIFDEAINVYNQYREEELPPLAEARVIPAHPASIEHADPITEDYTTLNDVLNRAYDQASKGKGKDRHAQSLSFDEQPIQQISNLIGTADGLYYQAIKKIQESRRLPTIERQVAELLGAIVYIAGAVIYEEKKNPGRPMIVKHDNKFCGYFNKTQNHCMDVSNFNKERALENCPLEKRYE